jgi:Flp pilus assembly protein TadD
MTVNKLFLILTLPVVLAACAGLPSADSQNKPLPVQPKLEVAKPAEGAPVASRRPRSRIKPLTEPGSEETLPSVPLSADVMVRYLAAEIAYQRGSWQAGYVNMLALAQQTGDPRVARRAAEIALSARQAGEALAAVRLWRQLAPTSDEASQFYLGLVMLGDDLTEAKSLLQQKLEETRPALLGSSILQIQRLAARARNKGAAFNMLEDLFAPYDKLPETHIALAQQAASIGESSRAVQEARRALTLSPSSELAILTLAQVVPPEQAPRVVQDFLRANPKAREVRLAYARLLVEDKQYEAAKSQFQTLLKAKQDDVTVLYALGLLSMQTDNQAEAERYLSSYLEVLETNPDEERDASQALMILSQIAEQRNDFDAALKWIDQVEPNTQQIYISAQVKRAQLLAKAGRVTEARTSLHESRAEGEDDRVQLLVAEAAVLRSANQVSQALALLEAGLKQYPENTDLLYDYAMQAEKLDRLDLMEKALRRVIELAPNNQHAYNALGYSLAERGIRLEEAYALISKAVSLAPDDPFIMDSMGWVQYRLGRLKEAEALLRKAYSMRPDAEIAVHLGEVLWVIGMQEDARKYWRAASSKDPKNDALRSTLARLQVKL